MEILFLGVKKMYIFPFFPRKKKQQPLSFFPFMDCWHVTSNYRRGDERFVREIWDLIGFPIFLLLFLDPILSFFFFLFLRREDWEIEGSRGGHIFSSPCVLNRITDRETTKEKRANRPPWEFIFKLFLLFLFSSLFLGKRHWREQLGKRGKGKIDKLKWSVWNFIMRDHQMWPWSRLPYGGFNFRNILKACFCFGSPYAYFFLR